MKKSPSDDNTRGLLHACGLPSEISEHRHRDYENTRMNLAKHFPILRQRPEMKSTSVHVCAKVKSHWALFLPSVHLIQRRDLI